MEEQNEVQTIKNKKKYLVTVFLIIVFSLTTGVIVLIINKISYDNKIDILNLKISTLEKNITELKNTNTETKNIINENNNQENNSDIKKLKNQLELINHNLVDPISKHIKEITSWNKYTNNNFDFEISYPNTFIFNENDEINQRETGVIIKFLVFDEEAKDLSDESNSGYFTYATISYWDDINNNYAKGGSWVGERQYKNLDDLFTDEKSFVTKNSEIKIDGKKAFDVTIAGHDSTHGIMIEYNDGIYRIEFSYVQNPPDNSVKERLISSFKFVD